MLAAAPGGGAVVTGVASGARDTRLALAELVLVSDDLSSERASVAAHRALLHLDVADLRLRRAVDAALVSLEADGGLSDEQRHSVARIRSNLVASHGDLKRSFAHLSSLIADKHSAKLAAEEAATAEQQAAAAAPTESYGGCPAGSELSPDGQLCSGGDYVCDPNDTGRGVPSCAEFGSSTGPPSAPAPPTETSQCIPGTTPACE